MNRQHFTSSDLRLNLFVHDKIEDGLLFFCHCVNGFSFASHLDYASGLYKFDDGICDFYANGFDCRDCCDYKCVKRQKIELL